MAQTPKPAPAGLENAGELVLLGVFGAAQGLKGEIRIKSFTGDPLAIADYGPLFSKDGRRFDIKDVRPAKDMVIARVKGISDRTAAEALTNLELFVPRAVLGEPEEDEFFHADLIGLPVFLKDGAVIGTVSAVLNFGAGEMLDIIPVGGGKTFAIPFTKLAVPVIDIKAGRIEVDPPTEIDGDTAD